MARPSSRQSIFTSCRRMEWKMQRERTRARAHTHTEANRSMTAGLHGGLSRHNIEHFDCIFSYSAAAPPRTAAPPKDRIGGWGQRGRGATQVDQLHDVRRHIAVAVRNPISRFKSWSKHASAACQMVACVRACVRAHKSTAHHSTFKKGPGWRPRYSSFSLARYNFVFRFQLDSPRVFRSHAAPVEWPTPRMEENHCSRSRVLQSENASNVLRPLAVVELVLDVTH